MANRNYLTQRIFNMHVMPIQLDGRFSIGAGGAPTIIAAPGIASITRKAAGIYQLQLQDNYNGLFIMDGTMESPVTGLAITAGSFVVGIPYSIVSLGNTTTAQWVTAGLPSGVTPAVGAVFVAASVGAGTGTAKAVGASGITQIEQIGPLQNKLPPSPLLGAYLLVQTLGASVAGSNSATAPGLASAGNFAVLGASGVTNTGATVLTGDLGSSPTGSITGFPPGTYTGTLHSADAVAAQAQIDLTAAYNDLAGRTGAVDESGIDLGTLTLTPGIYKFTTSAQLTGTLTLNAQGNPNAVWIFQIGTTLTTASASSVVIINGGNPGNVYWQVGSSATLGTTTAFLGSILAQVSITANTGATVQGRLLARTGAVTLASNTVTIVAGTTNPALIATDPASGSIMQLRMLINNSSLQ